MRIATALLLVASFSFAEPPKRAGYLGARLANSAGGSGVRLVKVFPDTPAAKAGLLMMT